MIQTKLLSRLLGALQIFIGLGAIGGGVGLLSDPSGQNVGIPIEFLENSPFTSFLIPGLVLFTVNGLGSCIGSFLSFKRYQLAGRFALGLGIFLILWIIIQVWWIGLLHWLQPLYFVLGLLEIILGGAMDRSSSKVSS